MVAAQDCLRYLALETISSLVIWRCSAIFAKTDLSVPHASAMHSRMLRTAVLIGLLGIGAGCATDETGPLLKCSEPAPDTRVDGTWRGQLSGRELAVTLTQGCALVFIYPKWVVWGTWSWGVSSGSADLIGPQLSLKGNAGELTFRGVTIRISETPPYHSVLTGSVDGELPLTASPTGTWQPFSNQSVILTQQGIN